MVNTSTEFGRADKEIMFDGLETLNRGLECFPDHGARNVASQAVVAQLGEGKVIITRADILQTIADLDDSGDYHDLKGNPEHAGACRKGFNALTQTYMNLARDPNVFGKLPEARILDEEFKPIFGAKRPDPHEVQKQRQKLGQ